MDFPRCYKTQYKACDSIVFIIISFFFFFCFKYSINKIVEIKRKLQVEKFKNVYRNIF